VPESDFKMKSGVLVYSVCLVCRVYFVGRKTDSKMKSGSSQLRAAAYFFRSMVYFWVENKTDFKMKSGRAEGLGL